MHEFGLVRLSPLFPHVSLVLYFDGAIRVLVFQYRRHSESKDLCGFEQKESNIINLESNSDHDTVIASIDCPI